MKVIWAPWRMEFILGEKEKGCFVCKALTQGISKETLILDVTSHSLVMLNRYPYISGHLMVLPQAHVGSLDDLTPEAFADLHETLRRTVAIARKVLNPHGINVGMNLGHAAGAGLEDHIHWHVVPRFQGDANSFNILADARVIPESLEATWERFRPAFNRE